MKSPKTSGFTLVELLVVIAMLMLLAGAITSSISSAQKRAKIAQATAEAQEMTNAILAYQHFGDNYKLPVYDNQPATEANLSFILGGETGPNGAYVPDVAIRYEKGGEQAERYVEYETGKRSVNIVVAKKQRFDPTRNTTVYESKSTRRTREICS